MTKRFLRLTTVVCLTLFLPGNVSLAQEPDDNDSVDPEPRLAFSYGGNMRFGLNILKDAAGNPVNKRLTYSPHPAGREFSNTTVVAIDGKIFEFGGPDGLWLVKDGKFVNGSRSVWAIGGIHVSQILEIVPSKQPVEISPGVRKRLLDTCLIRYKIENKGDESVKVGLRILVDTLIGDNDGVPFAVPRQGMISTVKDFPAARDVPDFVQALEKADLLNPGTVGHMTLKVGGNVEPPGRVSLTRWPKFNFTEWEVPLANMEKDSCVVCYWDAERVLKPGETRNLGFAYGLGAFSSSEGTGKLALTLSGSFGTGELFTVTAYVQKPAPGQTLVLEAPPGLERVEGKSTEIVPPAQGTGGTSIVTWKIKGSKPGQHLLKVRSSTGATQSQPVSIHPRVIEDAGKLTALTFSGPQTLNEIFTVTATVKNPLAEQTLTLALPRGLVRREGEETQPVPSLGGEQAEGSRVVHWKVKIQEPGTFAVTVNSSDGGMRSKSLSVAPPMNESRDVPKKEPKIEPKPEVKRDLTLLDARRALQMSVGNLAEDLKLDVNADGQVTALDAAIILELVLDKTRKGK